MDFYPNDDEYAGTEYIDEDVDIDAINSAILSDLSEDSLAIEIIDDDTLDDVIEEESDIEFIEEDDEPEDYGDVEYIDEDDSDFEQLGFLDDDTIAVIDVVIPKSRSGAKKSKKRVSALLDAGKDKLSNF